jgi:hypothetical protein
MMMRKIVYVLPYVLVILLFLIFNRSNDYYFDRAICYEKNKMSDYYLHSVVFNKYIDSTQHNRKTLLFKNIDDGEIIRMSFQHETGGFYLRTFKGDTIIKNKGSLIVTNNTQSCIDTLNYNCKP